MLVIVKKSTGMMLDEVKQINSSVADIDRHKMLSGKIEEDDWSRHHHRNA